MASSNHNFDRESMLLLYVAGEMPAKEHARVEAMLASDAALRQEYEQLALAEQAMSAALRGADATTPMPASQSSSVRRVSAAIGQWQIDRLSRRPSDRIRHRRIGWASTIGGVAAAIVVTVFILWSRVDDNKVAGSNPMDIFGQTDAKQADSKLPDELAVQKASPAEPVAVADPGDQYAPANGETERQLNTAERDLFALSTLTDELHDSGDTVTP